MHFISTFNGTFFSLLALTLVIYAVGFIGALIANKKGKLYEYNAIMTKPVILLSTQGVWVMVLIGATIYSPAAVTTFFALCGLIGGIIGLYIAYQKEKKAIAFNIDPQVITIALQETIRRSSPHYK